MILSIDIGIRSLSLNCLSFTDPKDVSTYTIHLWDVYDSLENENHLCKSLTKKGEICGKKSSLKHKIETDWIYTCKTHFPKGMEKNNHKTKKIKEYDLQDIAKSVIIKFQNIYDTNKEIFDKLDKIVLELQLAKSPKMLLASHIIYGKLVELYMDRPDVTIKFKRASEKLRYYDGPEIFCKLKGGYAQRKWLSIQYCKYFLENRFSEEQKNIWLPKFMAHSTSNQNDASDSIAYSLLDTLGIAPKIYTEKFNKFKKVRKSRKVNLRH